MAAQAVRTGGGHWFYAITFPEDNCVGVRVLRKTKEVRHPNLEAWAAEMFPSDWQRRVQQLDQVMGWASASGPADSRQGECPAGAAEGASAGEQA